MPLAAGIASAAVSVLGALPQGGGKKKKFAKELLQAQEDSLRGLVDDLNTAASEGESVSGFALKMVARRVEEAIFSIDAVGDVLVGEDDDAPTQ